MSAFKRKHFLENSRFSRLLVLSYLGNSKYECLCDCGNVRTAYSADLLKGKVKSCGCLSKEKVLDLVGQRFEKLLVLEKVDKEGSIHSFFLCRCDCGEEKVIRGKDLTAGKVKSCGNHAVEAIKKANTTHGDSKSRLYNIHKSMIARCYRSSEKCFHDYGGRGIRVCDDWLGDCGYLNFKSWAMSNGYSDQLTIDRIDVNGNYEPNNCRWSDWFVQVSNRRITLKVEIDGEEKSLSNWCRELDLRYDSVWKRINKYGYDPADALTKSTHKLSNWEES
jgi:hypothetical protein